MNAKKVRAAVADISADTDPTRKAAKLASLQFYPQSHPPARDCAKKLAAVVLGGALELDWKEVRRLASRPEYGILTACQTLVREVANELEIKSPLDSNR